LRVSDRVDAGDAGVAGVAERAGIAGAAGVAGVLGVAGVAGTAGVAGATDVAGAEEPLLLPPPPPPPPVVGRVKVTLLAFVVAVTCVPVLPAESLKSIVNGTVVLLARLASDPETCVATHILPLEFVTESAAVPNIVTVGVPTVSLAVKVRVTVFPGLVTAVSELFETITTEVRVGAVVSTVIALVPVAL